MPKLPIPGFSAGFVVSRACYAESAHEDNDWDVIAAREMLPDEKAVFDRYTGRK